MELSGLFVVFSFCIGCVHSENVATGTTYTFKSQVKEKIKSFEWKFNKNLVVEWDFDYKTTWYSDYESRANITSDTGDLRMRVLKSDSGNFVGQFQVGDILKDTSYVIQVIDPVSKPHVECKLDKENITLICSVKPLEEATFSWTGPNQFSYKGNLVSFPQGGSSGSIYFCIVQNEVSKNGTEFDIKNCPKVPSEPGNGGVIACTIIGILILILVVVGLVYYFFTRGSPVAFAPANCAEETTLADNIRNGEKSHVETNSDGANANLSKQDGDTGIM